MNKTEFIKTLSCKTGLSIKDTEIINKILEDNFFVSKKNKDKIASEISKKLDIKIKDATNIYEAAKSLLNEEIKRKCKHPFKSLD